MSQMSHGPFGSASHHFTKQETAELLAETMTEPEFQALREAMIEDRYGEQEDVPESVSDLPELKPIQNLPIYDSGLKKLLYVTTYVVSIINVQQFYCWFQFN